MTHYSREELIQFARTNGGCRALIVRDNIEGVIMGYYDNGNMVSILIETNRYEYGWLGEDWSQENYYATADKEIKPYGYYTWIDKPTERLKILVNKQDVINLIKALEL